MAQSYFITLFGEYKYCFAHFGLCISSLLGDTALHVNAGSLLMVAPPITYTQYHVQGANIGLISTNKELVKEYFDSITSKDLSALLGLFASDAIIYEPFSS